MHIMSVLVLNSSFCGLILTIFKPINVCCGCLWSTEFGSFNVSNTGNDETASELSYSRGVFD